MWYNVDVTVEGTWTISVDAGDKEEAAVLGEDAVLKYIKHFNSITYVETKVEESNDQSSGKAR